MAIKLTKNFTNNTYTSEYGAFSAHAQSHQLGRFGEGSVDLVKGTLRFESEDFAWQGKRMPVSLKHIYDSRLSGCQYTAGNSAGVSCADFSAMKLGCGFRLNLMQSMVPVTFIKDGATLSGYAYCDENGSELFFEQSEKTVIGEASESYNLYTDVNGQGLSYDPVARTLEGGAQTLLFDAEGRLVRITDSFSNSITVTYAEGKITSVTDGAGRSFAFSYNANGFLTSVTAPDGTAVTYMYDATCLRMVSYPNGKKTALSYTDGKPSSVALLNASMQAVYKVAYEFDGEKLTKITEYGAGNTLGVSTAYSYSDGRTLVTVTEQADGEEAESTVATAYAFDASGNLISEYVYSENTGSVGSNSSTGGINPFSDGSGIVSNVDNLLLGHSFETLEAWTAMEDNASDFSVEAKAYEDSAKFGKKVLCMQSCQSGAVANGVYQQSMLLPAGEYAFSAYLRIIGENASNGGYIRVTAASGAVLAESERIAAADSEYTRLIAPFEISEAQSVSLQLLLDGEAKAYFSAPQLEKNTYANGYNFLENGNFEQGDSQTGLTAWTLGSGAAPSEDTCFNMSQSLRISGEGSAFQKVNVCSRRSTRESFTLSGWAKAPVSAAAEAPTFRLRAVIYYNDTYYGENGTESFVADFSPATSDWQLASVQFEKSKYRTVDFIRVYCDYGNAEGTAYFDNIQLTRDSIERYLSPSDFTTEVTGETDSDIIEEPETDEAADFAPAFEEATDTYGNPLTETRFTDGEFGTLYTSFAYNEAEENAANAGNDLVAQTDARGNETTYNVSAATSRNEQVTDRLGNKTAYEYDAEGKVTRITSKTAADTELASVGYAYDVFDNVTEIARGDGMKYALSYNAFHNLESVGVDGKAEKLVRYTYKNGNGKLKQMTYANGSTVKLSYNGLGQPVSEKWYSAEADAAADASPIAHYKYVYDGSGNIVRSLDMLALKEYNYEYESGVIVRATESAITLSGEIVTSKSLVNSVRYTYDSEGELVKKTVTPSDGTKQVTYYETDDNGTVTKLDVGGKIVTSHSKTDSFGRKVFDELQLGKGFVSRQYVYHGGEITQEHKESSLVKSTPTTQLVSRIILSDGTELSYGYDAEERISHVVETRTVGGTPVTNTTLYTYDALGQLVSESVNGNPVTTVSYDSYGNITSKNGKAYTYGDSIWKDLLTSYDGQAITYDAQGNPISYLGDTLTWEKGRQLKSFGSNTYTYNANGIRTGKVVNGVAHTYTLDGMNILREVWGENELTTLYDNEEAVCGITFNGAAYFFLKNLQGDVIALTNADGEVIARYTYDAWGKILSVTDNAGNAITDATNIALVNPYRYRSYYYDTETSLYYLNSRYYNPETGRFVTYDVLLHYSVLDENAGLLAVNTYCYCINNPVNYIDIEGKSITAVLIGIGIGALLGALGGWAYSKYFNIPKSKSWKYILGGALIGAFLGGCAGYSLSAGSGAVLWSGEGMDKAAAAFAKHNGLKVLEQTIRGRLLTLLSKKLPWTVMSKLWASASARFLVSYAGRQKYIHIFMKADNYGNMKSVFNSVEMQIVAELGLKIIWHFVK